jgi:hypothetical protein
LCKSELLKQRLESFFTSQRPQASDQSSLGIADARGPKEIILKDKGVSKKNFSKATVFFVIGVSSLTLTGRGFAGNSTKAKMRRVTNQTKAFQIATKSELDHHQQENNWIYIGTSKEGVKLSYSPKRTVKRGRLIRAWFKGEFPNTDQKISSSISLHEFNCPKGTYRLLQGTLFFRDGGTSSSNQPSAWEYPLPDSVAEMEFKQVCRKRLRARMTCGKLKVPTGSWSTLFAKMPGFGETHVVGNKRREFKSLILCLFRKTSS